MSIEIDYLRKKTLYFQRWQFFGLLSIASGTPLILVANLLVLTSFHEKLYYLVLLIVIGNVMVIIGVIITIYYSKKFSHFIVQWSEVMEEVEKSIKDNDNWS